MVKDNSFLTSGDEPETNLEGNVKRRMKIKKFYILSLLGFIALSIGGTISTYYFYKQLDDLRKNPQSFAQRESQDLVAQVGRLIVLPDGESPTIATVADEERLKDQAFFAKAKKGDKVLIYTNAKKAILYDPVENKIIEVAPVNIGNPSETTKTQSPTTPSTPTPETETSPSVEKPSSEAGGQ